MNSDQQSGGRMRQRYLLATPVSFARGPDGRIWLDDLWWRDLSAHLDYLDNITVLAPCRAISQPEPGTAEAEAVDGRRIEFVEIFPEGGLRRVLPHLIKAIRTTWTTVGRADLVHCGVAGWPIPIGAIVNPIAVLRRKPLIIVIESAFWRLQQGTSNSRKARLRAWLTEQLARWSLRKSSLAIYTHEGYRESLPTGPQGVSVVLPASWISPEHVISAAEADAVWDAKPAHPRFLLASRLVPEKGISLFISALHLLEQKGKRISIDVIGSGTLRSEIDQIARNSKVLQVRLLDPVPYGAPFLQLLRSYHATIVPVTGDEQARVLYDSFSQGVPVIATNTDGNREVVTNGHNGFLFQRDDPEAFAEALITCSESPESLRKAGLAALDVAANHTHADMHSKRADLLRKLFGTG